MLALTSDTEKLDRILSQARPFGDSEYIDQQMRHAFTDRLSEVGNQLPAARRLLRLLEQTDSQHQRLVLGDPLLRAAIQQALTQIVTGAQVVLSLDECSEVFLEATRHIELGVRSGLLESGVVKAHRLGSRSFTPWIWSVDRIDDIYGRCFKRLIEAEYGEELTSPSAGEMDILDQATELLQRLLPMLSRSAFSHAHLLGIFPGTGNWEKVASSSQFRLTGAIFLNKTALKSPWWVAEHLLHESLHQKLYDFRHAHSLLGRDDEKNVGMPDKVQTLTSLWNTPGFDESNVWDPHRAIAAFHVYAHLTLFCSLAENRAPELRTVYGSIEALPAMTSSRKAFERAYYLGENLRTRCWDELGIAGRGLVEWFNSLLEKLAIAPPAPGALLHLLLDRYQMEAAKIQQVVPSPDLSKNLSIILEDEIAFTRTLLHGIDADAAASAFSEALLEHADIRDGFVVFPRVRRLIAETILRCSVDGYHLDPGTSVSAPDEEVRNMVDNSSRRLALIGAIVHTRHIPSRASSIPKVDSAIPSGIAV